jgi:hypothetical protein
MSGIRSFGFPVERMRGAFEHLLLLGDRVQNQLQGRAAEIVAERARLDIGDDLLDSPPDRAECF